ncbi:MAG TPA: alkaline phosphatase family protein, partial [Opitutus sp.]|nr:alkaline phosphatase family protein [Opitutus sp.]
MLDAGHLPALASLIQSGSSGSIRGFAPWLPPVSWTTLATGAHPDRHGIHGVAVFDEAVGRPEAAGTRHRRLPAIWNRLSAHGHSCAVLGWPGTYPAEVLPGGIMVSDGFAHAPLGPDDPWPVPAGAVSPVARAADLAELRLRPSEIEPGLLGLFLPKLNAIDLANDSRPGWLLQQLSELYALHNTAVVLCGEKQPDFLAVHFPFIATVQKEFGLFQAPAHPAASAVDRERYSDVVSSAYRVQDALLADLINACEPGTAIVVVSAHGLAHGADRPARRPRSAVEYAAWCRPHGLLVMKGPGLRAGAIIANAHIEDLAPT